MLTIDVSTEEFYFTGSDSGESSFFGVRWSIDGTFDPGPGIDASSAVSQASDAVGVNLSPNSAVGSYSSDQAYVRIELDPPSVTNFSVTGNSTRVGYSGWGDSQKSYFESLDGEEMQLVDRFGSGFSPISVAVIPEPGSATLVAVGLGSLLMRRRVHP